MIEKIIGDRDQRVVVALGHRASQAGATVNQVTQEEKREEIDIEPEVDEYVFDLLRLIYQILPMKF